MRFADIERKAVLRAIEESVHHDRIAHIDDATPADLLELQLHCEDCAYNGTTREYWGTVCDSEGNENTWRVHAQPKRKPANYGANQ
jgi:hypothetical protein